MEIMRERERQIEAEGWTIEHDDSHLPGTLAVAGACYALESLNATPGPRIGRGIGQAYRQIAFDAGIPKYWPWEPQWWKPKDERRNLIRAAALIIAEIERLDRAGTKKPS